MQNSCSTFLTHTRTAGLSVATCLAITAGALGQDGLSGDPALVPPGGAAGTGPFEQEGDIRAGTVEPFGPLQVDWADENGDPGVIDNLDFIANPLFPGLPPLQKQIIISHGFQALLYRDPNTGPLANPMTGVGSDATQFSGTSNKNGDLIWDFGNPDAAPWTWSNGSGLPKKNDLTNTYLYATFDEFGHLWLLFGAETRSTNGDSHLDLEWNQAGIDVVGDTSGFFVGLGPDGGRTASDFVLSTDFVTGGVQPVLTFRKWVVQGEDMFFQLQDPPTYDGDGNPDTTDDQDLDGDGFPDATIYVRTVTEDEASMIPGGPWGHFGNHGNDEIDLAPLQFVEGAVDLTGLGLADIDVCSSAATAMFKTRTSQSFTAELADMALVPFPLAPTPDVVVIVPAQVCPGGEFEVVANEMTGLDDLAYVWEVVSGPGQIIGSPFEQTVTVKADPLACGDLITLRVAASAGPCTDVAENTVLSVDDQAPVLSGVGIDETIECTDTPIFSEPTALDLCDPIPAMSFADVITPGDCPQEFTVTRTWTATDACGNVSPPASQTITVVDTSEPVITGVGPDDTIECTEIPLFSTPTALDLCDPAPAMSFVDVVTPGDCPQEFSVTRTWTATDACGNVSPPVSQTFNVVDTVAPEILGVGPDDTIECTETPLFSTPTAIDLCDPAPAMVFEDVVTPGDCPEEFTVTRTWTATDACGNVSPPVSQTFNVVDTAAPVITGVGPDDTIECTDTPLFSTPTALDLCDPDPAMGFEDVVTPGDCPQEFSVTRTWTAIDACGNMSEPASQTITVVDIRAPEISGVGPDDTIECTDTPLFSTPTAQDLCDPDPAMDFEDAVTPGDCPQEFSVTRTWTAIDACGNMSEPASQTITVVDTVAPEILGVGLDETIECTDTPIFSEPFALDVCDPAPALDFVDAVEDGDCPQEYSVMRTWFAMDACGNMAEPVSQTITVVDTVAPVISGVGPGDTIDCTEVPLFSTPTALDLCDPAPAMDFDDVVTPGDCPQEYTVTRTWTATDACGNVSPPVSQTFNVIDTIAPEILDVGLDETIECTVEPIFSEPTSLDLCDPAPAMDFEDVVTPGDCPQEYTVTRTWTAIDACGNEAVPASQTFTVVDTVPPFIKGPPDMQLECFAPAMFMVISEDACGDVDLTYVVESTHPELVIIEPLGDGAYMISVTGTVTAIVRFTSSDECGNSVDDVFAVEGDCAGGEGCTPGYWRQPHHFFAWTAPYDPGGNGMPGTLFGDVFDDAFPNRTLHQVLSTGGGGLKALGRHTVAALLNAASPDVAYDLGVEDVIMMFNDVYPGTLMDYEALKNYFESLNEQGCPLGNAGGESNGTPPSTSSPLRDRTQDPGPVDSPSEPGDGIGFGESAPPSGNDGPTGTTPGAPDRPEPGLGDQSDVDHPDDAAVDVFVNDGRLAPRENGGLITVDGHYVQSAEGVLEIELRGIDRIIGYDALMVTGRARLDGSLVVELVDPYLPQVGDRFDLVRAGSIVGEFSNLVLPETDGDGMFAVTYAPRLVTLRVVPTPIRGDLNGDGTVGVDDLVRMLGSLGSRDAAADFDGSGAVDTLDLLILLQNWSE